MAEVYLRGGAYDGIITDDGGLPLEQPLRRYAQSPSGHGDFVEYYSSTGEHHTTSDGRDVPVRALSHAVQTH